LLPDWSELAAEAVGGGVGVDPVLVLGEGLLRLLRWIGGAAGCLVLLEDLHWADADTLALVEYLAGAVRDSPVLVAASARDDWPAAAVDRLVSTEDVTTLRLARLSADEVGALAASRVGAPVPEPVRRLLADRSEGVPFLALELLAGLAEHAASFEVSANQPRIASIPRTFADLVT
jgi:predicted ATPase